VSNLPARKVRDNLIGILYFPATGQCTPSGPRKEQRKTHGKNTLHVHTHQNYINIQDSIVESKKKKNESFYFKFSLYFK
jgi:hypothetical protein